MLEISLFLLISAIFIILEIILIILFMKHLKSIGVFMEEMHKEQMVLYKEMLEIKKENNSQREINIQQEKVSEMKSFNSLNNENNLQKFQTEYPINTVNDTQTNLNTTELKFSQVSEEELLELLKGKEQVFNKQINIQKENMFIDLDIDIEDKK